MTMSPEDFARRLRATLDKVEVPERPWAAVRQQLIRRGRRRRLQGAAALAAALAVIAIVVTLVVVLPTHGRSHGPASVRGRSTPTVRSIPPGGVVSRLKQPGALAVGPGGQLYVADDGLNQILQVLPGGKFRVVAGNGKRGFSGDGRHADSASLNNPGGLAVTRSGTLYIADTGNNRIRAVSPSGIISTVAGDGRYGNWVASGTPALTAGLGSPADVAIGPGGTLYIADQGTSEVMKMSPARNLVVVAGKRLSEGLPGGGLRASETSADGPNALAFDRSGNLYVAGSNTKTLLVISRGGLVSLPVGRDGFYPDGAGGLATAPDGSVLAMNGQEIERVTGHGAQILYILPGRPRVDISGFLPNGIAVAANGAIYLDTYSGNGSASKTALIVIGPSGKVRLIWES